MTDLTTERWQLPDGVDELLPDAAWRVEGVRRRIMDCCHCWGFELVMPPIIEYVDSLLTGTGEAMDTQTFKFIDQHNGRTLGVRADMTPQVARMDAHTLRRDIPNRLFYIGTVLRARTDGFGGSRSPQQFGAELYGHAGPESDIEMVHLMLETVMLARPRVNDLLLDLGHVGVYRRLIALSDLDAADESRLRSALQRGSRPDARLVLEEAARQRPGTRDALAQLDGLLELRGDVSIIDRARDLLAGVDTAIDEALQTLGQVTAAVQASHPELPVHIDLAELRGYRYHTGMLFALYSPRGEELANGGRYDDVGAAFGRARPATGFSGDLKRLVDSVVDDTRTGGIFAPADASDTEATRTVARLRRAGERVVMGLSGTGMQAAQVDCDRELIWRDGRWQVCPLGSAPISTTR